MNQNHLSWRLVTKKTHTHTQTRTGDVLMKSALTVLIWPAEIILNCHAPIIHHRLFFSIPSSPSTLSHPTASRNHHDNHSNMIQMSALSSNWQTHEIITAAAMGRRRLHPETPLLGEGLQNITWESWRLNPPSSVSEDHETFLKH